MLSLLLTFYNVFVSFQCRHAESIGVDAIAALSPSYYKPESEGNVYLLYTALSHLSIVLIYKYIHNVGPSICDNAGIDLHVTMYNAGIDLYVTMYNAGIDLHVTMYNAGLDLYVPMYNAGIDLYVTMYNVGIDLYVTMYNAGIDLYVTMYNTGIDLYVTLYNTVLIYM